MVSQPCEPTLTAAGLLMAKSMIDAEWGSRSAVLDAIAGAALIFGTDEAGYVWCSLQQLADWIGTEERTARARVAQLRDIGVIEWVPGTGHRPSRFRVRSPRAWRVQWRGQCSAELAERRCLELGLFHVEPDPESLVERAPGSALYRDRERAPGGALYRRPERVPGGALYRSQSASLGARSTQSPERAPESALYVGREVSPTPDDASGSSSLRREPGSFDRTIRTAAGAIAHEISKRAAPVNGERRVWGASFVALCELVDDYGLDVQGPAVAWVQAHHAPGDGAPRWVQHLTRAMAARHLAASGAVPAPEAPPVHPAQAAEDRYRALAAELGDEHPDSADPAAQANGWRAIKAARTAWTASPDEHDNEPLEVGTP